MNHAYFHSFLATFILCATLGATNPNCSADDGATSYCSSCDTSDWSNCRICRCYDHCYSGCDKICQFRLIDGCTKCAWSRTWHAPNALATPLRQYYVPRPPQCCWYNGSVAYGDSACATWESQGGTNCQNQLAVASSDVSPEAALGFSPAQFERLGKIRNELDVVSPVGGASASGRPATGR